MRPRESESFTQYHTAVSGLSPLDPRPTLFSSIPCSFSNICPRNMTHSGDCKPHVIDTFLFNKFVCLFVCLFVCFWLCWVFVAVCGLSLVAASGGYSLLRCAGFSLWWLLFLRSMGSRCTGFSSCGSRALERKLSSCGARA